MKPHGAPDSRSGAARLLSRVESPVSPWVRLVAKTVELRPGAAPEVYHCLAQRDYVAILAETGDGRIPLVRQYRPAVDAYTWELPAGLLEPGESPEDGCRRELREETGLAVRSFRSLGSWYPDTGRLENRQHGFYVQAGDADADFSPEPGLELELVDVAGLRERVRSGEFRHALHLGVLAAAAVAGFRWTG